MTTTKKTVKKAPAKNAPATKIEGRPAVVEELRRLGWDGPTSYTLTVLRDELLPWVAAGKPEGNDAIPAGAMNHAHPKQKATRRLSKGYLDALADVLNALDAGDDVRDFVTVRLADGEAS